VIWAAVAAILATAAVVVATRRKRTDTVVLGEQWATANANEAARLAAGNAGPSAMPKTVYDQESGDYDFTSVTEGPLDRELRALVRAFKVWPPDKRADNRCRTSIDEQYTLIHFAKRSSVLALQEQSMTRCGDGLLALAMIDETRVDPRDAAWAVDFLAHAIEATAADRERLVKDAAILATPGMAKILLVGATPRSESAPWGYRQIETAHGSVGLIRSGSATYEPTLDMSGLAIRLAANLRQGRYVADPELAVDLPAIWFSTAHRADAERSLKRARAAIAISGSLRKAHTAEPSAQLFVQWVVEMPSAEEANRLVEYVGANAPQDTRFTIGLASGRLFSLLVAGSSMDGVKPFESPETLAAIAKEIRPFLQETAERRPGS
jgi:hypothetical protein